jgi:signal peptidase I
MSNLAVVSLREAMMRRGISATHSRLACLVVAACAFVLTVSCTKHVVQHSGSMEPTIKTGDTVTVHMLWPWSDKRIPRGTLVFFKEPVEDEKSYFVKRVVGVADDTIQIVDGVLLLNGSAVKEPYVGEGSLKTWMNYGPITVPKESVFVLGDNRARSMDSRRYGPVPVSAVWGTVTTEE